MIKLGVDVGGTFTDLVLIDEKTKLINITKVPSTPRSPDQGGLKWDQKGRKPLFHKALGDRFFDSRDDGGYECPDRAERN